MARRGGTRRSKKGLFTRVYSPLYHLIETTRNVGKSVFRRSGRIVNEGLGAVQNVGSSVAKHANASVRNLTSRKNRKTRKSSRKNRR